MSLIYIKNNNFYKKTDNTIVKLEQLDINKKDIITSSLELKNTISFTFKLPKSTPEEQLLTDAEIYFYENAGLDLNKEYVIDYIIKELKQEDSYLVEAIAVTKDYLIQEFQPIVEKTKFIDFISFMPFTFEVFYSLYNKKPKRDAFIYLDETHSFINVFEDGKYVYSKTMSSLNSLLKSIQLDIKEFKQILEEKGLEKEEYSPEEFILSSEIEQFFSKYFMDVNNRLSYGANIFYLEPIENIYFYTPFKIKGINSLQNFWEMHNINFEIIPTEKINLLDKLAIIYNERNHNSAKNFSIFPRPKPFYKTKTFTLIMTIFLSMGIFGGHFGYEYYQIQKIKAEKNKLNKKIKLVSTKLNTLKAKNKAILDKLAEYKKKINAIESQIKYDKNLLESALEIINQPKTYEDFVTLANLLHKNKLRVLKMSKDVDGTFILDVYTKSRYRDNIANFMYNLTQKHYKNIRSDAVQEVNNNYYISEIRFKK